ncbi:hypothetical protein [Dyella subtropica]|uniref:hypothetical protein n=1 Tax=Dyella subtropica TaxID=2992127 RepID=UPI002255D425|nr:hypothetical protein [Dyella subtropica]
MWHFNRKALAGCALTIAAFAAHADGGTVMFSGAIVEPTCSVGLQRIQTTEAGTPRRYNCTEQATASPGHAAQAYALSVVSLAETPLASDRLVAYFAQYLSAQSAAPPKLVTQTYE